MTSPIAPAPVAPASSPDEVAIDEEAPDFKPVVTPLTAQPEAFEAAPVSSQPATASAAASSDPSVTVVLFSILVALGWFAARRLFRRSFEQGATTAVSMKALEGRIAALEAAATASGTPVLVPASEAVSEPAVAPVAPSPDPTFDHEAMQARMDEIEKTLARLRKKASPKRASASKE
jgi:hypothetical protein